MEKFGTIEFRYFINGDYVITHQGYGVVIEDEKEIRREEDLRWSDVFIQHKEGSSNNAGNRPIMVDRECVSLTTKDKYDSDGI